MIFADLISMEIDMVDPVESYTEDVSFYSAVESLKGVIEKLIVKMTKYLKQLQSDVMILKEKREVSKKLKNLEKELSDPENKDKVIEFPDIANIIAIYKNGIDHYTSELDKLIKKDYTKYDGNERRNIDKKFLDFEKKLDKFEDSIDAAMSITITKKGKSALDYVKHINDGTNIIYKSYFKVIHSYESFRINAEAKLKQKTLDQTITFGFGPKKASLLKKFSNKMSKITRKIIVKIVCTFA